MKLSTSLIGKISPHELLQVQKLEQRIEELEKGAKEALTWLENWDAGSAIETLRNLDLWEEENAKQTQ